MKKVNNNIFRFRVNKSVIIITFFLFTILIFRLSYLCLVNYKVGDGNIVSFIQKRNTKEEIIFPKRGTIYDINGNILASDVVSYTLIAYLSKDRVDAKGNKSYVDDIDLTSKKLADVISLPEDKIKEILNNGISNNKYQVEFGPSGKNLTELTKEKIDDLNLQGIDFIKDTNRYYPNSDFASYLLGYTVKKKDENGNNYLTGEMGTEEFFDNELRGKNGYIAYEKDKYGYKILNGREYIKPAVNGNDIYLTIDDNIELFLEKVVKEAQDKSEAEWVLMAAMDAKTGKILGYSSTPSFDPNLRNMTSYIDPLASLTYEPGSTMKVFSYMCAIDSGKYDGSTKYQSGTKKYESALNGKTVTISDWNKKGWGNITYDEGFALSSNIAVANIVENVINKDELKACYNKYGFGHQTGFTLNREEPGVIDYKYQIEAAIAGYGQGITTTPLQHLQGLSIIANNGEMVKPYVIDKIVDSSNGKTIFKGERKVIDKVASKETTDKLKELMASVINGNKYNSTGYTYYMDGFDLIGKTGTAQIYDYKKGHYLNGVSDYIYSFSGMFPKKDPEVILYAAVKKPKDNQNYIAPMIKEVEENITNYLNMSDSVKKESEIKVTSFYNKDSDWVKSYLEKEGIDVKVLGKPGKIIDQYPSINTIIHKDDLVILKTNNQDNLMPSLMGLSKKEVLNILRMLNIEFELHGNGYATYQSIKENEEIKDKILIEFEDKY